jgi:hypothetical protein
LNQWYPEPTGDVKRDETNRVAFMEIYGLQARISAIESAKNNSAIPPANARTTGITASVTFSFSQNNNTVPVSVVVQGQRYTTLTFRDGILVAIS